MFSNNFTLFVGRLVNSACLYLRDRLSCCYYRTRLLSSRITRFVNLYDHVYLEFAVESIVVTIPLPVTELGMRPMFLSDIIAHNHLVNFIR